MNAAEIVSRLTLYPPGDPIRDEAVGEISSLLARVAELEAALQPLVDAGTTLLLSSRQSQDEWDAFSDALSEGRAALASTGEEGAEG